MFLKVSNNSRESNKVGNRALHEARDAGESLSKLREAYWREAHGGKKVGWKNYVKEEFVDMYRISYTTICEYIKVYVNWDDIVKHGWDTKTYSEVVYKILPLHKEGKPIPQDNPVQDTDVTKFRAKQRVEPLRQETTQINYLEERVAGLTIQVDSLMAQRDKYKGKYLSLVNKLNLFVDED